jgi:hypothetical protein
VKRFGFDGMTRCPESGCSFKNIILRGGVEEALVPLAKGISPHFQEQLGIFGRMYSVCFSLKNGEEKMEYAGVKKDHPVRTM